MITLNGRKTNTGQPKKSHWQKYLQVFFGLSAVIFITALYANWQRLLHKLDNNRTISAFVINNQTQFTQYDDIRDTFIKMGGLKGFFSQDITVVRKQIETIPWLKAVTVRKLWPDKLSISITEHQPAAIWNDADVVSNEGVVFQLPMQRLKQKNLPHLSGPDYQSHLVLQTWSQMESNLKQKGLVLKKLAIDERGAWQATLENEVLLKLGRGAWQEKLDRLATIYPQIEVPEKQKLAYVDLRYDAGAAVGFTHSNIN